MPFAWSCLEKVTGVVGGISVLFFANTDPTGLLGTAVAAAGLLGWWRERHETHGPEDNVGLAQIRKKVVEKFAAQSEDWDRNEAIRQADLFLARHLQDCTLRRDDIARSAFSPEGFPTGTATVLLQSLREIRDLRDGEAHPLESGDGAKFARDVIEAAFAAALEERDYFARLYPYLWTELAKGQGRIERGQEQDRLRDEAFQKRSDEAADHTKRELAEMKALLLHSARGQAAIRQGVDPDVIIAIAVRLSPDIGNGEQALIALDRAVEELLRLRAESDAGTNLGELVDEAVRRIAARIEAKDLNGAQAEGEKAFADWRKRKEEAARREAERQEAEQAAGIRLADETARAAYLAGQAANVAIWIAARLSLEADTTEAPLSALNAAHTEWLERGRAKGLNLDLEVAEKIARLALARTELSATEHRLWLTCLGDALSTLGEREAGTARLEAAIQAYEQALLERTEAREPFNRAGTLNNLGSALATLGGREAGTARLEAAVQAYEQALLEQSQERVPLEWAGTQNNLGNALATLGGREAGTARLEAAVQAYEQALLEFTLDRAPLQWAMTQNNLGSALFALGAREGGTARLEAAVYSHEQALQEFTRDRVPLQWAMTQNNLGNALAALSALQPATPSLHAAIHAYEQALLELVRDRMPLQWATTQNNLGNALLALGAREAGTARQEAAVHAYEQALREFTRDRVPLQWAKTQNNLGNALMALGEREAGTARLETAVHAYEQALLEQTQERVPLDWAMTILGSCFAQAMIAMRRKDLDTLNALAQMAQSVRQGFLECGHSSLVALADHTLAAIASMQSELSQ